MSCTKWCVPNIIMEQIWRPIFWLAKSIHTIINTLNNRFHYSDSTLDYYVSFK